MQACRCTAETAHVNMATEHFYLSPRVDILFARIDHGKKYFYMPLRMLYGIQIK
jgi:hypothetical protein